MDNHNQEVRKVYTIEFDEHNGLLTSILVEEEGGFGRWLYKREPKGMELPLTDKIFEEAVEVFLDNGIFNIDELYEKLLNPGDECYAYLVRKAYKAYIKKYVFRTKLHQDAFWSD